MNRAFFLLILAALETTLVSLPVTLSSFRLGWLALLGVTLLGRGADWLTLRAAPQFERAILGGMGLLAGLFAASAALERPIWAAAAALLPGGDGFGTAYLALLIGLFLFWRGTRLALADSLSVMNLFSRGGGILIAILLLSALGANDQLGTPLVTNHLLGYIVLGLMALALAHANDDSNSGARTNWRWLLTLGVAVLAVVIVGGVFAEAITGSTGSSALQQMLGLLLLPLAFVGGLITWLVLEVFGGFLRRVVGAILAALQAININILPEPQISPDQAATDQSAMAQIQQLVDGATWLMALIPVIIAVIVIVALRSRRRPPQRSDEERESLGVAASLGSDLRDLFGRLRNPFARNLTGLRAALAAISDDAPSSRVRRAYIHVLLAFEARDRARRAAQTPHEFAPTIAAHSGQAEAAQQLTSAYEQARYRPAGVSAETATAAESARSQIESGLPRS